MGTDLNRNYGYRWACCGGSSGDPASETYRGPAPFSAPETDAVRRFVEARPHLRTAISYHSYGDQVLYPYGYTYTDVPPDMTPLDHRTFVAMADCPVRAAGGSCQATPAVVAGATYFVDGTNARTGPAARIAVFANSAEPGFTYQLVSGRDGGNQAQPCSTQVAVVNPAPRSPPRAGSWASPQGSSTGHRAPGRCASAPRAPAPRRSPRP